MKDCFLDHIAIVVEDLDSSEIFYESLGLKFNSKREVVESEGVVTSFAKIGGESQLELLAVHGENSPIEKFIKKKGPGIHHLSFQVLDIEKKTKELKEKGVIFVYEKEKKGANNCLINFIHPKSTGGVLIELSQRIK